MEAAVRDFEYISSTAWETVESAGSADSQVTSQVTLSRSTANNDVSCNGKLSASMVKQFSSVVPPSLVGIGAAAGAIGSRSICGGGDGEEKFVHPHPQPPSLQQLQPSQRKLVSPLQSLLNTDKQRRKHAKSRLFKQESNRDQQLRGLNRSLAKANAVLSHEGFAPVRLLKFTPRCALGLPVSTMFGAGIVTRFRPSDGIYEVLVQWDTTGRQSPIKAYLTATALLSAPSLPVPLLPYTAKTAAKTAAKTTAKTSTTLSSTILSSTSSSASSGPNSKATTATGVTSSLNVVTVPSIVYKVKPSSLPKERAERATSVPTLPPFKAIRYV